MARKLVATLATAAMGCVGGAYISQHCSVQREEREKSTLIRMTWQNRDIKGQETGLSNNLRVNDSSVSTAKEPESKCPTKPAEPNKCGTPKEPESKCLPKPVEPPKCGAPKEPESKCPTKPAEPNKCGTPKEPESKCPPKPVEPLKCGAPKEPESKCPPKTVEPPNKCNIPKEPESKCPTKTTEKCSKCPQPQPDQCDKKEPPSKCNEISSSSFNLKAEDKCDKKICQMKETPPARKRCRPRSSSSSQTNLKEDEQTQTDPQTCSPKPESPGEIGIKCAQSRGKSL